MNAYTGWQSTWTNKKCHAHHKTSFNNHPYISSSKFRATATYVGMHGCWTMWPWYGVCALHFLHCLCTLSACACIHWAIPTSARFIFRNSLMESCFCSFVKFYTYIVAHCSDSIVVRALTIGDCFKCYTYRIMALGWLRKERKMMNNSDFRPFQVCHFKIATTYCYYYCRLRQALYKLLDVLLDTNILISGDHITMKTLIHWLEHHLEIGP